MSNSPSARYHRTIVRLAEFYRYKTYGPLIGPKEQHQPNPRWDDPMSLYDLRGKCRELSESAVAADPLLRLVRGWYHDPVWGRQEHWWTERPDGSIYDPTAAQFPSGGVSLLYEEYKGVFPCQGCGIDVNENDPNRYDTNCSWSCYGRMVGVL